MSRLPPFPGGPRDSILKASKLALTVLTDGLRSEFTEAKSRIKVTVNNITMLATWEIYKLKYFNFSA